MQDFVPSGVTAEGLIQMLHKHTKICVIDVRDADFGDYGVIKGAIHLPFFKLNEDSVTDIICTAIEDNHCEKIVCYCEFGRARSVLASHKIVEVAKTLEIDADKQITFLKGGISTFVSTEGSKEFLDNVRHSHFEE